MGSGSHLYNLKLVLSEVVFTYYNIIIESKLSIFYKLNYILYFNNLFYTHVYKKAVDTVRKEKRI